MNTQSISASIIGAAGYSGAELLRILRRHPHVRVKRLFAASNAGKHVADVLPQLRGSYDCSFETYKPELTDGSDIVFLALPSGEAMHIVPELLARNLRVIDLGGDFRLRDPKLYEQYYTHVHAAPDSLLSAVYGLPEWNRAKIAEARLVANPGCYPTSVILPLAPLLRAKIIAELGIIANSLSGVSGAGRSSSAEMSFAEVNESVRPYKVGVHQHIPEIEQTLGDLSGMSSAVTFIPHLLPITRGILSSIATTLVRPTSRDEVMSIFRSAYKGCPFVRILEGTPEIKNVVQTNFIDIGFSLYERGNQLLLFSTIDNLVKGAAGQAVQNMNLMFGFNETEGLM
jgi:N-acetyl-gamma-glutamyl-phosphate reductase